MASQLSMVILGQSKVGKSSLGNKLLGLKNQSGCCFFENNGHVENTGEDTGRRRKAIGPVHMSELVVMNIDYSTQSKLHVHVVDTPGLFKGATNYQKNWRDFVHAFDMSKNRKIDSFLLLLRADDATTGKKVVKAFLDMYGEEGRSRCFVIFTYNRMPFRKNCLRHIQIEHFEYLTDLLKSGFPFHVWKNDEDEQLQRQEVIVKILEIAEDHQYTKREFIKAQEVYTYNLVKSIKVAGKLPKILSSNDFMTLLGVPDVLFGRYFSTEFTHSLIKLATSEIPT